VVGVVYPENVIPGERPSVSGNFHEREPFQFRIARAQEVFPYYGRVRHFKRDGDFLRGGAFQLGCLKFDQAREFLNHVASYDFVHVDKKRNSTPCENDQKQGNGKNKKFPLYRCFGFAANFILFLLK
jgi:hypothetical protein